MSTQLKDQLRHAELKYREGSHSAAFDSYLGLAESGHVDSQLMVAWMLLEGLGVPKNEARSAAWFAQAAALGSSQGLFYYGRYLTRIGRHEEARRHYRESAKADYLPAVFWMGRSAALGQGTEQDVKEAYEYLRRAAKRGHLPALRDVGVLDLRGESGFAGRILGIFEFAAAVVGTFLLALIDRDSDKLRA